MTLLAQLINSVFNTVFDILNFMSESLGLFLVSAITGIVMLFVFKWTSNQKKIKQAKDKIKAHILEIRLYKDSPRVIMRAFGKILRYNTAYLILAIVPLLIVFIPVVLILVQLSFRYSYRGFSSGDRFILQAQLRPGVDINKVSLESPESLLQETPALLILAENQINWRLRVEKPGEWKLALLYGGQKHKKEIIASDRLQKIASERVAAGFFKELLNPSEAPLAKDAPFEWIKIQYPNRQNHFLGLKMHWLLTFFVLSLVFAFVLKGPLKVEI